jgi:chaperone modulatory protein CbpM
MTATRTRTTALVPVAGPDGRPLVALPALARAAGLHPELVLRLVRLGLVERAGGTVAMPLYGAEAAPLLARAERLRRDLALSYAGAVLACQLLGRIDELESRLRRYEPLDIRPR